MAPPQETEGSQPRPLVNRPQAKLPPIPKGSRIHKRSLPSLPAAHHPTKTSHPHGPGFDLDGYRTPPRAPHTTVIKVSSGTPFMAVVKRVRGALENGPQQTKGLPLTARIAALGVEGGGGVKDHAPSPIDDALEEAVLVATGRAIQKALEVGMFFRRNKELMVLFRTRTVSAIDDILVDDGEGEEEQVRVRQLSCVEVGIRRRK